MVWGVCVVGFGCLFWGCRCGLRGFGCLFGDGLFWVLTWSLGSRLEWYDIGFWV